MKIDQKENLCNTMITSFMASAKQIAWRKKFARMSKAGKFKKRKSNVGSHYVETQTRKEIQKDTIIPDKASRIRTAKGYKDFDKHLQRKMIIDKRSETSVYITMGNWEVYLDNSTGEHYITSDGIEK